MASTHRQHDVPRTRTYSAGPLGLTRWGTFGAYSVRVWKTVYQVHRAAPGRVFPNGRRWKINKGRWS